MNAQLLSGKVSRRIGDYEVLGKIGQGGMGSIYKARDARDDSVVAIKLASRAVLADPQLSRRFEIEYSIAHRLKHRNLVKVLGNGTHEQLPYLAMEYVDGPSLSEQLTKSGPLGENDALAILMPIADVLTYLHRQQIIHRDVKPANILLTSTGDAKLADLGLVKNLESMSHLTRSHVGLGTMQFASPEQFDDARRVDIRSDIYSLAATLYLMLTGEFPFGKGSVLSIMKRKLQGEFDPLITKAPNVRPCINAAICAALKADRESRPATIQAFVARLTEGMKPREASGLPESAAAPPNSDQERRAKRRHAVDLSASCRPFAGSSLQSWMCAVTDVSLGGMCLLVKRRFEPGTVLEVTLKRKRTDRSQSQSVRVRWARKNDPDGWLLGCESVKPLMDEDLNSIVVDGMGTTSLR